MAKTRIEPTHPYAKSVLAHIGSSAHQPWAARVRELLDAGVGRAEAEVLAAKELIGLAGDPDERE